MSPASGQGGGPDRERLIESHLPLVRSIARRYAGQGESVEDLIQVGSVALIRASDRFDPQRGVAFATFAAPAVEGEIRRHLGDRSGSVRIPRELRRMTGALDRSRRQLAASLGRSPTLSELAEALGVEEADVRQALEAERAREPLPEASDDVVEAMSDPASLESTDDRLLLAAGARVLDERERRIVFLRFHADMTEREIAREVGISQAQVSRLLTAALVKLRNELEQSPGKTEASDTTPGRVISPAAASAQPKFHTSAGRNSPASQAAETRIGGVGALEEQVRTAQAADAQPTEDLALPYHVTVKSDVGDQGSAWIASVDELPGCEARGATQDEAVENLRSAMEIWLSAAVDEPRVISPPRRGSSKRRKASSASGRFLVRMPSDLHEALTRAAEREQVSLNRFVTTRLAAAVGSPSSAAPAYTPTPAATPSAPPQRSRSFRVLLAANLLVIVLAAGAAIALLVLALERGV